MTGQQRHTLTTLPERWNNNGKDLQPVIETLTKPPLPDQGGEVPVGGGDDANINRPATNSLPVPLSPRTTLAFLMTGTS
jgi:hypothetical protein